MDYVADLIFPLSVFLRQGIVIKTSSVTVNLLKSNKFLPYVSEFINAGFPKLNSEVDRLLRFVPTP